MTRYASWRAGAVVFAAAMLVAACGGGSGGRGAVDPNILPTGVAGATGSAHASKSAVKGAKSSGAHKPGQRAASSAARSSSAAHHSGGGTRGGGGGTGGGGGGHSTSAAPSNNCASSAPPAPSDPSKASITVCPARGLRTGDTVTITGHSFKPNESLIATECHYLGENANNYGLSQCDISNILNFKPAKTTRSDGSGNVGPLTLVVAEQFKKIDCSTEQCLISVAVPIQNGADDNPHVLIYFG